MPRPNRRLPFAPLPAATRCLPQPEAEGLLPEEDEQVPGGYRDAMTSNTPLGKAVKGACDELDTLGSLVRSPGEGALPACCPAACLLPAAGLLPPRAVPSGRRAGCSVALCTLAFQGTLTSEPAAPPDSACCALASSPLKERETLEEAEALLKKLGFKGTLFTAPPQQEGGEEEAEEQQPQPGAE